MQNNRNNRSSQTKPPTAGGLTGKARNIPVDYLRAFLTILVVLHHSAGAYVSFDFQFKSPLYNTVMPIIDAQKKHVLDLFVAFNDTFFMSLFFLLSGVYFVASFNRQGAKGYILGRAKRLGIPFLVLVFTIIPLTYWASHLTVAATPLTSFWTFLLKFFSYGKWSPGPLWFLWVLLAYSLLTTALYNFFPETMAKYARRPLKLFLILFSGILFLPLFVLVGPEQWSAFFGPFFVQTSRIGLYFAFFFFGTLAGYSGQTLLNIFPRNYLRWFLLAVITFIFYVITIAKPIFANLEMRRIVMGMALLTVCISMNLGLPGLFLNQVSKRRLFFDHLSANSYGIFLVHYPIVVWIQYTLWQTSFSALIKFMIVGIGGLLLSWGVSASLRKIPAVGRLV